MNQETIKAIEGSVRKHDCIAQGLKKDNGSEDCPLCEKFDCSNCPVRIRGGGMGGCMDTPYDDYHMSVDATSLCEYENLQAAIDADCNFCDAVEAEVEFLISLLPEDHEWRQEEC